ncbi:MAG: hypothetical protein QXH67_06785 [Candidatus Bathyarchaeia archaeon]
MILILYTFYSFFKGKTLFDILHHSLRYVLLFLLAYGKENLDTIAVLALIVVILFSVSAELISGMNKVEGTALLLGSKWSSIITPSLILMASIVSLYIFNIMFEFPFHINDQTLSFYIVPFPIITYIILKPLIKVIKGENVNIQYSVGKRELIIVTMIFLIFLFLSNLALKNSVDVAINAKVYSFNVEVQTIIAGKENWDVTWILFDYVDQNNFYYLILHKNGILELGQAVNGKYQGYIASLKTNLNPFQINKFNISLNKTTIVIKVEEKYELTAPRISLGSNYRVKIPSSYLSYIGKINILIKT